MTNISPNLNTGTLASHRNSSQESLTAPTSNKRERDSLNDGNPQAQKRQHVSPPVDTLLSKQFASDSSRNDNKAGEKLHSTFESTATPADESLSKTEASPLKRQTTYENLGVLFDKDHINGGEKIGSGSEAEIYAAGNDMVVRVPTPDENNTGLTTSNIKEYLVTQLIKDLFKDEPDVLNKVNFVESFGISRGIDNGGHYGDNGPLAVVAMPRMDTNLEDAEEEGKIDHMKAFTVTRDLTRDINDRLEDVGLVHSDFGEHNILMKTKEDGEQEFKVTDFGAAEIDEGSEAHQILTSLWSSLKSDLLSKDKIDPSKIENINLEDLFDFTEGDDF